jgi:hypothetical protein
MAMIVGAGVGAEQGGVGNAGVEGRRAVSRRNSGRFEGQVPWPAQGGMGLV